MYEGFPKTVYIDGWSVGQKLHNIYTIHISHPCKGFASPAGKSEQSKNPSCARGRGGDQSPFRPAKNATNCSFIGKPLDQDRCLPQDLRWKVLKNWGADVVLQ